MEAVLLGPSGRTVLESPVVSIGRAAENQLVLNNPRVSLYHAELHRVRQGYTITDLASGGGTFVNAQRLEKNVPHLLATDDMIHIGRTAFKYVLSGAETPSSVSTQTDQRRVLEDQLPIPAVAPTSVQTSSNGARESEDATLLSLPSTAPTQADRRSYLGDRPSVPTTPTRAGLRSYLGNRPPIPAYTTAPVSSNRAQERAGTMPASLPTQRPVLGAKNRGVLLVILLTLLLLVIVGAFVVRGVTPALAPTIPQTAVTSPGTSAAPTHPSTYPILAVSYAGTVSDLLANTKTNMFLTNIQQSQGTMQGSFQGLGLAGPFTGKVTPDGQVRFTVTISGGSMTLTFEGSIKEGGDIVGSYQVLDRQGSQSGYGLWNISAVGTK